MSAEQNQLEILRGKRLVFALTASYCTLEKAVAAMARLRELGCHILPVFSYNVRDFDSRFGTALFWREKVAEASGSEMIIDTLAEAEPIGPQHLSDILLIAPCSGNTVAKLTYGITDTPVLMAAKSHLRSKLPVVLAVTTNDGLSNNAKNVGALLNAKHIYFVPFGQDDAERKPNSLIADMGRIPEALAAALEGKQLQPLLLSSSKSGA